MHMTMNKNCRHAEQHSWRFSWLNPKHPVQLGNGYIHAWLFRGHGKHITHVSHIRPPIVLHWVRVNVDSVLHHARARARTQKSNSIQSKDQTKTPMAEICKTLQIMLYLTTDPWNPPLYSHNLPSLCYVHKSAGSPIKHHKTTFNY